MKELLSERLLRVLAWTVQTLFWGCVDKWQNMSGGDQPDDVDES